MYGIGGSERIIEVGEALKDSNIATCDELLNATREVVTLACSGWNGR